MGPASLDWLRYSVFYVNLTKMGDNTLPAASWVVKTSGGIGIVDTDISVVCSSGVVVGTKNTTSIRH